MGTEIEVFGAQPPEVTTALEAHQQVLAKYDPTRVGLAVQMIEQRGVRSDQEMQQAADLLSVIAGGRDAAESVWKKPKESAHATWKTMCGYFNDATGAWDTLRERLERPMKTWRREQEEAARRQQEEMERAAEALRKQKEAEARRLLREGEVAAAAAVKEQAKAITVPVLSQEKPRTEGLTDKATWDAEVTDPMLVIAAIAEGKIPVGFIKTYDLGMAKRAASAMGGLNWPGVRAWQETAFSVRRK